MVSNETDDIIENNGASKILVKINPFIAAFPEQLNIKLNRNKKAYNTEMECSRKEKVEDDVKNVVIRISTWLRNIWDPEEPIVKIDKVNSASKNMINRALNVDENGKMLLQEFMPQITSENSKLKYNDTII